MWIIRFVNHCGCGEALAASGSRSVRSRSHIVTSLREPVRGRPGVTRAVVAARVRSTIMISPTERSHVAYSARRTPEVVLPGMRHARESDDCHFWLRVEDDQLQVLDLWRGVARSDAESRADGGTAEFVASGRPSIAAQPEAPGQRDEPVRRTASLACPLTTSTTPDPTGRGAGRIEQRHHGSRISAVHYRSYFRSSTLRAPET